MPRKTQEPFDQAYYQRFYESKRTRVYGKEQISHLARAVTDLVAWYGGELRSALDVGAGVGLWRDWFRKHQPKVKYRSTEVSSYACERYGHEQRDITSWRAEEKFDLVICQGVLPYLTDREAERAIKNLATMSRGFLYLEAVTTKDFEDVIDREATDSSQHARTGAWYRERLAPHYVTLGCGLYYAKRGPLGFYELEMA